MWSMGFHARCSLFREQHRLVFPAGGLHADSTPESLSTAVVQGNCRAIEIADLEDYDTLASVHTTLQQACAVDPLLSRAQFVLVASTPAGCAFHDISSRVEQALAVLQLHQFDVFLLHAHSLPGSTGIYARKRVVLQAWEHLLAIQQAGLAQCIGVSDLRVQDVEFLLTAYPDSPPEAWSLTIASLTEAEPHHQELQRPLDDVTAYAHAHGIDLLVRVPVSGWNRLHMPPELRESWSLITQHIAERHRERPFKFLVGHEHEGAVDAYHLESHALAETTALQWPLQIVVRFLLQRGLILIPQVTEPLNAGEVNAEEERWSQTQACRELFGVLSHPFSALHPSCSPHRMYSSLLTRDDLAAIDRALPLTLRFPPLPAPATPLKTPAVTARDREQDAVKREQSRPTTATIGPVAE